MTITPTFPLPTLIQTVRAKLALMEHGYFVTIKPGEKKIYDYLKTCFPTVVRATFEQGKKIKGDIDHRLPLVTFGSKTWPLLFPKCMITKEFWKEDRQGVFFRGFVPTFRVEALRTWEGRAEIQRVDTGRKSIKRFWEREYFQAMGGAQFVLCPNGGWPWSYRFFEAIIVGAIPVVQSECEIYRGFHVQKWTDENLVYDLQKAEENFELCFKRLTY